jgi:hypothetical protein
MYATHIHKLLNHFLIVGTLFEAAVMLIGIVSIAYYDRLIWHLEFRSGQVQNFATTDEDGY